jgi:hypothetical protein
VLLVVLWFGCCWWWRGGCGGSSSVICVGVVGSGWVGAWVNDCVDDHVYDGWMDCCWRSISERRRPLSRGVVVKARLRMPFAFALALYNLEVTSTFINLLLC